jgi:hypothetical protein
MAGLSRMSSVPGLERQPEDGHPLAGQAAAEPPLEHADQPLRAAAC